MCQLSSLLAAGAVVSFASLAIAGGLPLNYINETITRMQSAPSLGISDIEEKDYAWADLNQDGWTDLVVMRRQPWGEGKRPAVLFMNEQGVLVDRTAQLASTSIGVPAPFVDQGFLTPTCSTDVAITDVNQDGWMDVISVAADSLDDPKHLGHPRVYINLGDNQAGDWQGLVFDNNRMPQLFSNPTCKGCSPVAANPSLISIAAGDVNGDGAAELYLGPMSLDVPENLHPNMKLLTNDGRGFFSDLTTSQLTASFSIGSSTHPIWLADMAGATVVADLNSDGLNDLVWTHGLTTPAIGLAAFNNPATPGLFDTVQTVIPPSSAPYFVSVADLNNDSRLDLIQTDDFTDRYLLQGAPASPTQLTFAISTFPSATNGFGSQNTSADLNSDGFKDVLISDVDLILGGCTRTADILINNGNPPAVAFTHMTAIPNNMLTGVQNFAVFDVNNDGHLDIVVGRCSGTQVWIFDPPAPVCASDLNRNGSTDGVDLGILLSQWATKGSADLNGSGLVDGIDLGILLAGWGVCR